MEDMWNFPEILENIGWLTVHRVNSEEVHFRYFQSIPAVLLPEFLAYVQRAGKDNGGQIVYEESFIEITYVPEAAEPNTVKTYRLERRDDAYHLQGK